MILSVSLSLLSALSLSFSLPSEAVRCSGLYEQEEDKEYYIHSAKEGLGGRVCLCVWVSVGLAKVIPAWHLNHMELQLKSYNLAQGTACI